MLDYFLKSSGLGVVKERPRSANKVRAYKDGELRKVVGAWHDLHVHCSRLLRWAAWAWCLFCHLN